MPPVSVDDVIELIREIKPDAQITRKETRLPFPESFDDSALRAHVSHVYETPLSKGIRLTMEHFKRIG
jgi:hypothetical protein